MMPSDLDRRKHAKSLINGQLLGHQNWLKDPLTRLWYSAFGHGDHPYRVNPGLWAMGKMYEIEPNLVLYIYMDHYESCMRAQYLRVTADGVETAMDMLPDE